MRITTITIKNFKGIDEQGVRVDFAPITMLFGPNNAGKSTIIQALHLAREVLCHNNPDPDLVEEGGEAINLGGFKEFVHKHDLDRDVSVSLGIDLEGGDLPFQWDEISLDDLRAMFGHIFSTEDIFDEGVDLKKITEILKRGEAAFPWHIAHSCLNRIEEISVQFSLSWGTSRQRAFVSNYTVFLDETEIVAISSQETGPQLFTGLNFSKMLSTDELESCEKQLLTCFGSEDHEPIFEGFDLPKIMDLLHEIINFATTFNTIVPDSSDVLGFGYDSTEIHTINPSIRGCALPAWEQPLDVSNITSSKLATAFLSSLLIGPGLVVRDFFERCFQYIGPLRQVPTRNYMPTKTLISGRWSNGLAAWDVLSSADTEQLKSVNKWLAGEGSLKIGYSVQCKKYLPLQKEQSFFNTLLTAVLEDADDGAAAVLRELLNQPLEARVVFNHEKSGVDVTPHDMGVGVSQVIPIVVAATFPKRGSIIAIEQPELHIHPAWQTVLGDLFLEAVSCDSPPMFLLETHSEHLILRLLRRIRETNDHELPDSFPTVTPDSISVIYVQAKENGGTEVIRLPITPDGDFARKWPNGFFAERAEELF